MILLYYRIPIFVHNGLPYHLFRFVSICFVPFCFVSFRFVSFRFDLFRFVSICFVSFRSVSFRFDLFRFVSISFRTLQGPHFGSAFISLVNFTSIYDKRDDLIFHITNFPSSSFAGLWRSHLATYTICPGLLLTWMFYSDNHATFQ